MEKLKRFFDFISRWYWDIVYKRNKYSSFIWALVFLLFAWVSIQYYQQLIQPVTQGFSTATLEDIQIKMVTPDKLYIGKENQDKVEFEVSYDTGIESADSDVVINWKGSNENLAFTKNPLIFKLNEPDADKKMTGMSYYRREDLPSSNAEIVANVTIGDKTTTISRPVAIAKAPNEGLAFIASIAAAILMILNLVNGIIKLFSKKE